MPIITIDIGPITRDQKIGLIEKLTAAAVAVTKIPERAFTVVINERDDDSIGVGGKTLGEVKKAGNP